MIRLYEKDIETARAFFKVVSAYLDSKTPKIYFEEAGRLVAKSPPVGTG